MWCELFGPLTDEHDVISKAGTLTKKVVMILNAAWFAPKCVLCGAK